MNMSSVNRHLSKLSPCWKWDVFADKCPNFSRRMRGCYISSRYPPIRDPALCADQPVRGSTGDTVICCCSQNPVNPGHVSRFVLLSRVTSRDAVTPWRCDVVKLESSFTFILSMRPPTHRGRSSVFQHNKSGLILDRFMFNISILEQDSPLMNLDKTLWTLQK